MADILCAVCGEPWDAYGVHHGDMRAWEARLFKAGAGCPCCAGEPPDTFTPSDREELEIEAARSMHDAWDDPHSFGHLDNVLASAVTGRMPKRPTWQEPEPTAVWTCAGCDVRAVIDPELGLVASSQPDAQLVWHGGRKVHFHAGFAFPRSTLPGRHLDETPDREPCHTLDGKPYCDACATVCDGPSCDRVLLTDSDGLDTYDPGKSFPSERNYTDSLCVHCLEAELAEADLERDADAERLQDNADA